ncbi:MAG: hypothetical protein WBQ25_24825, partial [Nitrososphaeraceae archaeon]
MTNFKSLFTISLSTIIAAASIVVAVNDIGNGSGTLHNAFAVGTSNTNFTNPNIPNATTLTNPNATITNTTAYPTLSLFLAHHKASELPIPSAERMFTPDKAQIMRKYQ